MGLVRTRGYRSWAESCVLLAALLGMTSYILFEQLDALGSRLPSRLAGEAVAAIECTVLDVERLSALQPSSESPTPTDTFCLIAQNLLPNAQALSARTSPISLRSMRARAHVQAQTLPAATPTADPF